jgi:hypothetical protein
MDQLWSRMQSIYSGLWRSMNNPSTGMRYVAQREWLGAIRRAKLSWSQVVAAADVCADGTKPNPTMPPTLPEFISLAKGPVTQSTAAHKPFVHLPKPTRAEKQAQRAAGRAQLDTMRDLLR